jgi:hypothetical protein
MTAACAATAGSGTTNVVPRPSSLATVSVPSWASTSERAYVRRGGGRYSAGSSNES